jgi:hypothetical protein
MTGLEPADREPFRMMSHGLTREEAERLAPEE